MKRTLLSLLLSAFFYSAFASSGVISIAGTDIPVDTTEHYQVGPGTWYTQMDVRFSSARVVKLYMLDIDLTDPNVALEARNGEGSVGQNEFMLSAAEALDSAGHRPIGAVNCNFFWTSASSPIGLAGLPTGGSAHDGLLMTEPDDWTMSAQNNGNPRWRDMGYVAVDYDGRVWMEQMLWDGKVTLSDNSTYPLRDCNRYRTDVSNNEIALFNYGLGRHATRAIDTGREVIFSAPEWRINGDMSCTVLAVNTTGGTILQKGQGCLQARGTGDSFLSSLAEGDTFVINLGVYAPHIGNARPDIKEMVMGNALCMVNGELITRNENETYNTTVYARTGVATNNEGNRLWMLVMQTGGMSTTEMCHVFLASGATYASGMDGGGSAQMEVLGQIKNKTTEGTPRSVNTMLFAMSKAPDDNDVARLDFVDKQAATVASYASYTPSLRAYNQYGWLLSDDFSDYTLSCSPASIGTISADGKSFIGSMQGGNGTITASFGSVSVTKDIIVERGLLSLRLDTLLIDTREYTIEAYSTSNGNTLTIDPSLLLWSVDNPDVCAVSEQGVLRGLSSGETDIHGTLDTDTISLHVVVEIASEPAMSFYTFANPDSIWTANNTYGDIAWEESNGKTALTFKVNSARSPQIRVIGDLPLYSIPDSAQLVLTSNVGIKSVGFFAMANNGTKQVNCTSTPTQTPGKPATYTFSTEAMGLDDNDIAIYPLHLQTIVITLQNVKTNTSYSINFDSLILYYHNYVISATEDIPADLSTRKLLINGRFYIDREGIRYDALGNIIQNK